VADVARRRTHQASDFVLLLVFGAIDLEQALGLPSKTSASASTE